MPTSSEPSTAGSPLALRVEKLGKRYQLGLTHHGSIRELLAGWSARLRGRERARAEDFWALRDVDLEVPRGEVLGIIGRNGAGKSTLLKILTNITKPTDGRAEIYGRVGSLLEVGTGFHPELTGRENVFLNGAILGMTRAEIRRRFDEIVAFAEIERFLDSPVKRYSSGMYVRLAFAVAAHLDPEILLVDEVLSVGDAGFQRKCLGKMDDAARGGRTILFVSHNLGVVERLCHRVVLLQDGRVARLGHPAEVIRHYLEEVVTASVHWRRSPPYPEQPHFRQVFLCDEGGEPAGPPTSASRLRVCFEIALPGAVRDLILAVALCNELGHPLFATSPLDVARPLPEHPGVYRTIVAFPEAFLMPKRYSLTFSLYRDGANFDTCEGGLAFDIHEAASLANSLPNGRLGDLQVLCEWSPFDAASPACAEAT